MRVLVDTSVWSLALRRKPADLNPEERQIVAEWSDLVRDGRVQVIGPIRQEILSGIRDRGQFEALQRRLSAFPDAQIKTADCVQDRKSTRLNSSHIQKSRMPSSA